MFTTSTTNHVCKIISLTTERTPIRRWRMNAHKQLHNMCYPNNRCDEAQIAGNVQLFSTFYIFALLNDGVHLMQMKKWKRTSFEMAERYWPNIKSFNGEIKSACYIITDELEEKLMIPGLNP
ncbi:hypothetical protein LOAG_14209 [Loa loa]|uniref:Uncharacterized protein n=1 Tax=Loa loa TaxID=7209 RepID=A0A1S0TI40_LOALO|nr:hypothetical protein LOAG_14209 [Loa loa]EFO14312.1 hypothetical protein LOAG_14209 [Loa loa]